MRHFISTITLVLCLAVGAAAEDQKTGAPNKTPKTSTPPPSSAEARVFALESDVARLTKQLEALSKQVAALEAENATLKDLSAKVSLLVKDNEKLNEKLAKLPSGPVARTAAKPIPKAQIVVHNWNSHSEELNVNGVWHNLKPGRTVIAVPLGPVTVHQVYNRTPRSFENWKLDGEAYTQVFDLGTRPKQ